MSGERVSCVGPAGLFCRCGIEYNGPVHESVRERLTLEFWRVHSGEGHGPTDAQGARDARVAQALAAGLVGAIFMLALSPEEFRL